MNSPTDFVPCNMCCDNWHKFKEMHWIGKDKLKPGYRYREDLPPEWRYICPDCFDQIVIFEPNSVRYIRKFTLK